MQRRFYIEELQQFLRLIDAELSRPCDLVLVGESALALGYYPDRSITDIEVWTASDRVLWSAAERASEKIARPIRLRPAAAANPSNIWFEKWLRPWSMTAPFRFLKIGIPEAHDLALLFATREPSIAAIADLHRVQPLSLDTLLERYEALKSDESLPGERARVGLLGLVAKLFGDAKAGEIERRLKKRSSH